MDFIAKRICAASKSQSESVMTLLCSARSCAISSLREGVMRDLIISDRFSRVMSSLTAPQRERLGGLWPLPGRKNPGEKQPGVKPTSTLGRRRTDAGERRKSCALHEDVRTKRLAGNTELLLKLDCALCNYRSRTIRP